MPTDITKLLASSLYHRADALADRWIRSAFSPRECRFLVFLEEKQLHREHDPYALFPEHIPYTRRDFVLAYYRYLLKVSPHHLRLKQAICRVSKSYPQPPLLKSDMVVSWGRAGRDERAKRASHA